MWVQKYIECLVSFFHANENNNNNYNNNNNNNANNRSTDHPEMKWKCQVIHRMNTIQKTMAKIRALSCVWLNR